MSSAVDSQIDTTTGTVKVRAQFDNADYALFPNQFVQCPPAGQDPAERRHGTDRRHPARLARQHRPAAPLARTST